MVESIKDFAIFTMDPDGHVVSWNSGAEQLFGYSETEVLGQHIGVLFPPEDRAKHCTGARDRRRRGHRTRHRRALAYPQGRQPVLRQRRARSNLRQRLEPQGFHQDRPRHYRTQGSRRSRSRSGCPPQGDRRHRCRQHHHHRRRRYRRVHEPGRRADLRLRPPGSHRHEHHDAHARALPWRDMANTSRPTSTRSEADHRLGARGRRPAQERLDLPHGAVRQRDPAGSPQNLHRNRPRHHRVQDRAERANSPGRRARRRARRCSTACSTRPPSASVSSTPNCISCASTRRLPK